MPDKKEKVVVTGGAGFIGSNLVQMLQNEGYPTVVIDNLSAGTLENLPRGTDLRKVDICEPRIVEHLAGASTVIHLAAKNCLIDCSANPVDTARVNLMGTANVLEAAVKNKVSHFIYADTSAEYEGIKKFPSPVDKVKPESVYACSKRGGALLCESFHNLHGLKVTYVRYFNVYGKAQDWRRVIPPVMSAFTIKLLRGERPVIYGTGKKKRDFIHVNDINSFHLKLLKEPKHHGRTYNLGSGKEYTIFEIYKRIEGILKTGIKPIFQPDQPTEALRTLADIKGTKKTGWKPKVSLDEGLKDFIEYMREKLETDQTLRAARI